MDYELILLVAIAVLLIILLILALAQTRKASKRHQELLSRIAQWEQYLVDVIYDITQGIGAQRSENASLHKGMNDSIINTLSQILSNQTMQLDSLQRQMQNVSRVQEDRLDKMRDTLADGMSKLQKENMQKLEEMRRTVDEKLHETLDRRLGESFSQVSTRLEEVYKGLGEMQALANGVGDLKKVLTNVKSRGIWGETQLGNLLAQVLSPNQYEANVAVVPGMQERVEYALKLPGRQEDKAFSVYLPIDSKFPQEAFIRVVEAQEAGDVQKVTDARKELVQALKTEAKRISDKYVQPPHTTDFAIMFLPLEGLYAEAMRDMGLVEEMQRSLRVVVAGPSTLTALLNSLQMGFRTLAIEKRSAEVWKLLGAVKTDFSKFATMLENTQRRLKQASDSVDLAFNRTKTIERHLRKVEALDENQADLFLPDEGLEEAVNENETEKTTV